MTSTDYAEAVRDWALFEQQQVRIGQSDWIDMLQSATPPAYDHMLSYRIKPAGGSHYDVLHDALADGHAVQYCDDDGEWRVVEDEAFDLAPDRYRVIETEYHEIELEHMPTGRITDAMIVCQFNGETGELLSAWIEQA